MDWIINQLKQQKPPPRSINEISHPDILHLSSLDQKDKAKHIIDKLFFFKYTICDHEGQKLGMRVIVFCPTILSTAIPVYDISKYLDERDILIDYLDNILLDY
jgi:hypothetical protein